MKNLKTYQVYPQLPESLSFLETLARNYWWSWTFPALDLFRRIDRPLWKTSGSNPIVFLTLVSQSRLTSLAEDDSYLGHLAQVRESYEHRVLTSVENGHPSLRPGDTVAYLSMEFGIHESLPIYSGGLGILAGDHLKAASNMGLPVTGLGLLYRQGYFQQYLDPDGWQQEEYPDLDIYSVPIRRATNPDGSDLIVTVPGPTGEIRAEVWQLHVGRIPLYLLDTNIQSNLPEIRNITSRLYSGGPSIRLAQEVLLGVGGLRALAAMGINAKVCHMNEGHSAFSGLERLAQVMETFGVDLKTAHEIIARSTVFTTHTPVAAGHDEFPPDLVRPILTHYSDRLGVSEKEILSWGQPTGSPPDAPMSMFILGLRMAQYCNGVSRLHGSVARRMWSFVWPDRPEDEIPISHVTNGIHVPTWVSPELALLFERYLGPEWYMSSRKPENIQRIDEIYNEELWRAHEMNRARLIRACRDSMRSQSQRRNAPKNLVEIAESALDQDTLTIGFARRFASYKRASLLMKEPERLEALLTSETRPIQIIMAGKAHPQDDQGKALIRQVIEFCQRPAVRRRIIFLENYNIQTARYLVQGCDVWLNTPRRPYEACGTSGMKAALNGGLNLSILDGWWAEGYRNTCGWAIGRWEEPGDSAYVDAIEAESLYNVLENDVIPKFYDRRTGEAPPEWIAMMKNSIKMAMEEFCSIRMVRDYDERYYLPAAQWMDRLLDNHCAMARDLAVQHERLTKNWPGLRVESPIPERSGPFRVGERFLVKAVAHLENLKPEEVEVHLYYGLVKTIDAVVASHTVPMTVTEHRGNGEYLYTCEVECRDTGRYAFTARIVPEGDDWIQNTPGLITWA